MSDKPNIILVGAGGHCAACIDVIEQENRFQIIGITDREASSDSVCGYPVLGDDTRLAKLSSQADYALITVGQIGSPQTRMRLYEFIRSLGFTLPVVVSPLAYVSPHAQLGAGTIVMHHALINARAKVGENCIINSKALIEHDVQVADHCHIATAAVINGGAVIGLGSFVGSNAVIIKNTPEHAFIKAGSLFKGNQHD